MDYYIELKKIEKKLHDLELALNESSIVVFTNNRGIIEYANEKFCELSKYTKEELIGSNHNIVNSGYHSREFFKEMWRTIGTGNVWRGQIKNKAKDGTYYWVDTTIVPFLNEKGKPYQYASVRHDITKLKEYEERIEQMAFHDPLTQLANRNWLNNWIKHDACDHPGKLAILFIDLNRFKFINDYYGHSVGDKVLQEIAKRLDNYVKEPDFVIRQSGDEFIVFLTSANCKEDIVTVVKDINEIIKQPICVDNHTIGISASVGISLAPQNWQGTEVLKTIEETMKKADRALARAKCIKSESYYFISNDQSHMLDRMNQLEKDLPDALKNEQFYLLYQPIVNILDNRITGVEALLRWKHPTLGIVPPNEFIPLLEELGYIIPVGNWIIETVSNQMKVWQEKGIHLERVAVNVSPLQFSHPRFINDVKTALSKTELEPKHLELEVTEQLLLDIEGALGTLNELNEMGISISIDDFGTGYSSLSYLNKIPINRLKIDRSFISDLSKKNQAVVNTVISLGKTLRYALVAEGIETIKQLNYLRGLGCEEGQGFFWSKPVDAEEIERIINVMNLEDEDVRTEVFMNN